MDTQFSSSAKGWRHRIGAVAGFFLFMALTPAAPARSLSVEPVFFMRNTGSAYELFHHDLVEDTTTKISSDLPAFGSVDDFQVDKKGRIVVYAADAEVDERKYLYLKNMTDGSVTKITNFTNPDGSTVGFQLDPKGKFVVYGADADVDNIRSLYRYDIASGETTTLFEMPPTGNTVFNIALNPNRSGVYFEADVNVITQLEPYYLEFKTGEARKLADVGFNEDVYSATFDPRGQNLYLDIKTINPHHYNLYQHDLKSGEIAHMVINSPAPIGFSQISQNGKTFVWAPYVGGTQKLQKLDTRNNVNVELDSESPVRDITMDKKGKNAFYIAQDVTTLLYQYNLKTNSSTLASTVDPVQGFVGAAYVDPKSRWLYYIGKDTEERWDLFYRNLKTGEGSYVNGFLGAEQRVRTVSIDKKNRFVVFVVDNQVTKKQQLYYLDLRIGFLDAITEEFDDSISFIKLVVPGSTQIFF